MRVLDVRPVGFRVLLEIDLSELESISLALDETELRYDFKDTEKKRAVEWLINEFYPKIEKLIKDVNSGT